MQCIYMYLYVYAPALSLCCPQEMGLENLLPKMLRYNARDRISLAEAVRILISEPPQCPVQWREEDAQHSLPEAVRDHLWEAQLGEEEDEEEEEEAA